MRRNLFSVILSVICLLTAALSPSPARADWLTVPLSPVYTPPVHSAALSSTGTVTLLPAAAASTQRWLLSAATVSVTPSTGTVAIAVISGDVTNTLATLTNGTPQTLAYANWLAPDDTLALTLADGATNANSVTIAFYPSPVTTNIAWLSYGDAWKVYGLQTLTAPLPAAETNGLALTATYSYSSASAIATFTNVAAWSPTAALWLIPSDRLDLTATRVTNRVPLRGITERQRQ